MSSTGNSIPGEHAAAGHGSQLTDRSTVSGGASSRRPRRKRRPAAGIGSSAVFREWDGRKPELAFDEGEAPAKFGDSLLGVAVEGRNCGPEGNHIVPEVDDLAAHFGPNVGRYGPHGDPGGADAKSEGQHDHSELGRGSRKVLLEGHDAGFLPRESGVGRSKDQAIVECSNCDEADDSGECVP